MKVSHITASIILCLIGFGSQCQSQQQQQQDEVTAPQTCYEWTGSMCSWEPNLQPMQVKFDPSGPSETFYAYVDPDISTYYNQSTGSMTIQRPISKGMFGKFINLSPEPIRVWYKAGRNAPLSYSADVEPFGSSGLATYVGHSFVVTPTNVQSRVLTEWKMAQGNSLYYYDPFQFNIHKAHKALTNEQYVLYHMQWHNKVFAEQYRAFTGRDWLALYKQKLAPRFHMWRADALGQTHQVVTKEIHFVEMPLEEEMDRGASAYGPRPDVITRIRPHRDIHPTLTLTLTVLSCAPRVFEIQQFLSDVEVEHLLSIARESDLEESSVSSGSASQRTNQKTTRTSTNSWIPRQKDVMTDAIYRRAADLLHMDESLLRWRRATEIPEFTESKISVAEPLQLVHYEEGQQYTPHHDFVMPGMINLQPSRFATILLYLNDDMEGGETSFPLWVHGKDEPDTLKVKPEKGKAILFYNLLPDGNYDQLSMHAAMPVTKGEKWLTNLWIWDPIKDHRGHDHL